MGRAELQKEYRERLLADPQQAAADWAWLWYLKELYAFNASPGIFELCQAGPKARALANAWGFVKEELSERELFDALIVETGNPYAANLLGAGIIDTDLSQSRDFVALCQEMGLEAVKALRPLLLLRPEARTCEAVATPTATLWLQFVDMTHELARLPRVRELKEVMRIDHPQEEGIRDSDDFTTYMLTDKEREDLKRDLEITAAAIERGR